MSVYFETGRSANSKEQKNPEESHDLAKFLLEPNQESNRMNVISEQKMRANYRVDERRTFTN